MQTIIECTILAMLAAWALGTLLLQVPHTRQWLRERDACLFLPEYRFFAPSPIQGDFHMLFRDTFANGTLGEWTEVCGGRNRRLLDAIWNPEKRERKAMFDAVNQLFELRERGAILPLTTPYLLLLNYVAAVPRTVRPKLTEFQIMYSYGWWAERTPDTVLVSELHRL